MRAFLSTKRGRSVRTLVARHRAQVGDQPLERAIGDRQCDRRRRPVDEAGVSEQRRQRRRFDAWMDMRRGTPAAASAARIADRELWQGVAARHAPISRASDRMACRIRLQRERQVIDRVERANRERSGRKRLRAAPTHPRAMMSPPAPAANIGPGSRTSTLSANAPSRAGPRRIGAADQQGAFEMSADAARSARGNRRRLARSRNSSGPVRAARSRRSARSCMSKRLGTAALVRWRCPSDKTAMVALRSELPRVECSISRCRRAAPAAGRSSPTCTASAPIAGNKVEFLGQCGCVDLRHPAPGDGADDLRRVPRPTAADRPNARRRGL